MREDTAEATEEAAEAAAALLTAEQVAQALGISTRRLRDWRKEGRITEVGRFKRGTARIPLFDPADVGRLQRAEETPAALATVAATPTAFAEAVARQVRQLLAERAEAEAAAVAPLVALVREQQETIDELRRRAEAAEAEREALRLEVDDLLSLAASAPPHEVATQTTPVDTPAPPAPAGGFWARVRRAFGGEGD